MEEITEHEIDFEKITKYSIDQFFPHSFFYPNQNYSDDMNIPFFLHGNENSNFKDEKIIKNIVSEKILIKDKLNFASTKDSSFHKILPYMSNQSKSLFDVSIIFNKLIFVVGESIIKGYLYDKVLKSHTLVFDHVGGSDEVFNSFAYSNIMTNLNEENDNNHNNEQFLIASGGNKNFIKVFLTKLTNHESDVHLKFYDRTLLIGHVNDVYDLKFHPLYPQILLSSSKDFSIRLWNAYKRTQICIFSGHLAEVLSIDIHESGQYFVSSGVDRTIKLWEFTEDVKILIEETQEDYFTYDLSPSYNKKQSIKILIKRNEIYSCSTIHEKYIDCVGFNNNFILSKSVDGWIGESFPIFEKGICPYMLINRYEYEQTEMLWYMKFGVVKAENSKSYLTIGNNIGEVFIFQIYDNEDESKNNQEWRDIYDINFINKINTTSKYPIRKVSLSTDLSILVIVNDNGELIIVNSNN